MEVLHEGVDVGDRDVLGVSVFDVPHPAIEQVEAVSAAFYSVFRVTDSSLRDLPSMQHPVT
jgi:hypothetical protein